MIRKLLFNLISLIFISLSIANAANDTLTVRTHQSEHLNWYGDFYRKALFPPADSSFKKILLKYTIGCPTSSCSDWDYTTKVFARRQIGTDTVDQPVYEYIEFARYITPYAGDRNFGFYREFIVDVTDYSSILRDSVEIGVKYEGYSDGFTVSLDFMMIKGVPMRDAYKVIPLYYGGFPYGDPNNSIENYLTPITSTIDLETTEAGLIILQTGHGFGGNEDCAEFCIKSNFIKLNGTQRFSNIVWKDDCGLNPLYPQPGTWLYDRANWCPGEMVRPFYHDISEYIVAGQDLTVDMDMTPFINVGNNSCSYNIAANLVLYKNRTATNDVELEEIISPNSHWSKNRFNPICSEPEIKIRNNGSSVINSLNIEYGANLSPPATYQWTGTIAPYSSINIKLPAIQFTNEGIFTAKIIDQDVDMNNNEKQSSFLMAKKYPSNFVIELRTNSAAQENHYEIFDWSGNSVHYKSDLKNNLTQRDTLNLAPGCYEFVLTDTDKDGLSFFANTDGSGYLRFKNITGSILHIFPADFGTEIRQQFIVDGSVGLDSEIFDDEVKVYPNPASSVCTVEIPEGSELSKIRIYNVQGQIMTEYDHFADKTQTKLDLSQLAKGHYIIEIQTSKGVYHQKTQIIEIK